MNTVAVLKAARELISDRTRWTTNTWARDKNGDACDPLSEEAVRWCVYGVIYHLYDNWDEAHDAHRLLHKAAMEVGHRDAATPTYINDLVGHTAVMQMLERAIDLADAEET